MDKLFRLDNKVALVTGGAGGIGGALALGLSRYGAKVVISSRNQDHLNKEAKQITDETGNETLAFTSDVTKEDSICDLVKKTTDKLGTIDILVNAMGMNIKRDAFEYPIDDWRSLLDINVTGTMIACKQVAAQVFKAKNQGKIINLSSVRGIRGYTGGNVGYCATKGAVELITKSLALEWAPYKINVNAKKNPIKIT